MINLARSDRIDSSLTMFGAATDPAESFYRSSSRQASQPSRLEPGSSRSTSTSTTPTSTAPPSSATGSAPLPHLQHDVPPYIRRQSSQSSSHSSMEASTTSMTSTHPYSQKISMSSSSQVHPADRTSHLYQSPGSINRFSTDSFTSAPRTASQSSPASPRLQPTIRSLRSLGGSEASSPSRIKIRDLSHIHSFASEEALAQPQGPQATGQWPQDRQYEISSMPVTDIIQMVAGLLTKITSTNDLRHEQTYRQIPPPDGTTNLSPQATSVLAFHGKNVPSITILSYLTRIHKYCPTTYEVFLSLLVYFDRMTEMVNKGQLEPLRRGWGPGTPVHSDTAAPSGSDSARAQHHESPLVTPPSSAGMAAQDPKTPSVSPSLYPQGEAESLSQSFVVDSFNIHRLVIAGVTCASKFFSDVFYTNSRYAKVSGLAIIFILVPALANVGQGGRTPPSRAQPS